MDETGESRSMPKEERKMAKIRFVDIYTDRWGDTDVYVLYENKENIRLGRSRWLCSVNRADGDRVPETVRRFIAGVPHIRFWHDDILNQDHHYYEEVQR